MQQGEGTDVYARPKRDDVRACNGNGPTCGCGQRSRLHVTARDGSDYFLCVACSLGAVKAYVAMHGQDEQGPPSDYYRSLLKREHENRYHGEAHRWCPDCEASHVE